MYQYEMQGQIQNGKNKAYSLTDEKSFDLDSGYGSRTSRLMQQRKCIYPVKNICPYHFITQFF